MAGVVAGAIAVLLGIACPSAVAAPGDRAFELVTPTGSQTNIRASGGIASVDGNTVCFASDETLLGSSPNGTGFNDDPFCSYRRADGWETKWLSGTQTNQISTSNGLRVWFLSDDGQKAVIGGNAIVDGFPDWDRPADPEELPSTTKPANDTGFLYENGALTWLTPRPLPVRADYGTGPIAVSRDFDRALFATQLNLLPDRDPTAPASEDFTFPMDVYMWTPQGLRLISVDENGDAIGDAELPEASQYRPLQGTISSDGSRAFFTSGAGAYGTPFPYDSVFMWEDGEVRLVSPRRGPDGTSPSDIDFFGASEDGEIVYLLTYEQLTSDPHEPLTYGLYRYVVSTDDLELVTDGLPTAAAALKISADGSTVFYNRASTLWVNRLLPNGDDETISVAPLDINDMITPQRVSSFLPTARALRIADDGSEAIFVSEAQTPGAAQVYRWDPETGVTRISSMPNGDPVPSHVTFGNYADLVGADTEIADYDLHGQWANAGRVWTDDHQTVYFQTTTALTADDQNSVMDVYEWRDGDVELVTPGTPGSAGFYYHASSADGSTVFFSTYARVLPDRDRNPVRDLYAARVGGGFPPLPPGDVGQPPPQLGPGGMPAPPGVGSDAPREGEQANGRRPVSLAARKLPARAAKALARRGRVGVSVRLTRAGRVSVRAVAQVRGKRKTVGRSAKRLRAGRRARVVVVLSRAARAQLRRTGELELTLLVSGGGRSKVVDQSMRG